MGDVIFPWFETLGMGDAYSSYPPFDLPGSEFGLSTQATALLPASVPSLFLFGSRPRLLLYLSVPAHFSAVLPSFAKSRPFRPQLLTNYI